MIGRAQWLNSCLVGFVDGVVEVGGDGCGGKRTKDKDQNKLGLFSQQRGGGGNVLVPRSNIVAL